MDYSHFINGTSSRRRPAITRELIYKLITAKIHYTSKAHAVSLAEGMPNEITFPIEEIEVRLKGGEKIDIKEKDLDVALQYLPTQGYPPLCKTLQDFMVHFHNPPHWEDRDLLVTNGSQCGISKSLEMVIQDDVPVLIPDPYYLGVEITLTPHRTELIPVDQDSFGIVPLDLRQLLQSRKMLAQQDSSIKMPKIIYINPTGANPNGSTLTLDRKKEIYQIASEYNLLIFEDDPYYFMHFEGDPPASFLSMDTEMRVMRFDSFSKVLSAGLRVGWLTGPKKLVAGVELHVQSSYLHSSSLSQVLTDKLLNLWGNDRFMEHCDFIRSYYKARRDCTLAAMERYLKGLCDWAVPSAGMFMWIKVRGVADVYDMLTIRGVKKNLLLTPGHAFMVDPTKPCPYIRASYSKATPEHIDLACKLLAELIRDEHALINKKIQEIS